MKCVFFNVKHNCGYGTDQGSLSLFKMKESERKKEREKNSSSNNNNHSINNESEYVCIRICVRMWACASGFTIIVWLSLRMMVSLSVWSLLAVILPLSHAYI